MATPSNSDKQQKKEKKTFSDSYTDTSDLDSCAALMDVYIPLHISGDGITRAITRTDTAAASMKKDAHENKNKSRQRPLSATNGSRTVNASSTTNHPEAEDTTTAAVAGSPQQQQQKSRRSSVATSTTENAHSKSYSRNPLASIPENFPVPACCSLTEIREKLEHLLRSKVFLGFLDTRTGGLVELRESTLELFNLIPDQKKAIHCRKLKKEKTRSELLLEASSKNQRSRSASIMNKSASENPIPSSAAADHHHHHHQDPEHEDEAARRKRQSVVSVVDYNNNSSNNRANDDVVDETPERRQHRLAQEEEERLVKGKAHEKARKREAKERLADLVGRLSDEDLKRREIRRKKLEQQMYPTEDNTNNNNSTSAATATTTTAAAKNSNGNDGSPRRKQVMTKQESEAALARLTDTETLRRRREAVNEQTRLQMINEGYIVEPALFKKVTHENDQERNDRYYGRGIDWLRKHSAKIEAAQQKEKERKAPKIKSREEWDAWFEKRSKPLERDRIAAENQPIIVPIGSSAAQVLAERNKASKTPEVK